MLYGKTSEGKFKEAFFMKYRLIKVHGDLEEYELDVPLRCLYCGNSNFSIPKGYQPEPEDVQKCPACGKSASYGEMTEKAIIWSDAEFREIMKKRQLAADVKRVIDKLKGFIESGESFL